jgi:hypothetical protein
MEDKKQDDSFSIEKATELLKSFVSLMKDGCVSNEVYNSRRKACETCAFNQKRASDEAHFCGSCGCGARDLAKLYIEGIPIEEDDSVRLWMPKNNCPKDFHQNEKGTGNFKPIGGRLKQLKNLTLATMGEAMIGAKSAEPLEYINSTVEIIEDVVTSEEEMDQLTTIFEESMQNEAPPDAYNNPKGENNENQTTEHPHSGTGFRGDSNS